ncbi:terpene synthase family protein [Streptomyces sp. GC420]|uniref:terpene synthase family protein n=1 Tax=Streptomyces sp. GC420 TaxID=2697568 RepID=UPI00141502B9|nr:terpene synthase family protein [Streptomyces sp. GC420]NBM16965.1 hypothetical protein [Streptomyces sp. GC420]
MAGITRPRTTTAPAALPLVGTAPAVLSGDGTEEEFHIPELPRLLPVAYHPKAAQIEFQSNAWVCRMLGDCFADERALLAFLRQRNGLYGSLTVPAATEERARDIADFYQFATVVDDAGADRGAVGSGHDRARAAFARIMASFGPEAAPDDDFPYSRAAGDLWRRITPGLAEPQVRRFRDSLEANLRASGAELSYRSTETVPDLDSYLSVRVDSFGFPFILLLTEYGAGVDATSLHSDPDVVALHRHAVRQMILINDVLSWRKEHALHDTMNAVRVVRAHDGLSLQQAVNRVCGLAERHELAYIETRDRIRNGPLGGREDVLTYLDALDHMIGGSQEFEYLTPRYYGDGYVWDGATSGWISLTAPIARFRAEPGSRGGSPRPGRGNH